LRLFDGRQHVGGVLHAKYFMVDEAQAYLGSQNFDWRALEHIHEMGLRIREPRLVRTLRAEFEADWARSGENETPPPFTETWQEDEFVDVGNDVRARPAFSSEAAIRTGEVWDLPQIVALLDSAQNRVRIQLLTYSAVGRDKTYWDGLESALRSAAARGVEVQMAIAHWGQRPGVVEGLQSLQCLPNIEIKFATIPEWSGGYISFARVIHAKYLVVDGTRGWIGTSNWEKSYFFAGRNVGVVFEGAALGQQLDAVFERLWDSEYTETVDPSRGYPAPQFGEQG